MVTSPSRARPALSIVIPAPSDTTALEETLVSVLENRPPDCEIVVALGCEYGDPWNIGDEVRFVHAPPGSSLVGCTNLGVAASSAGVVHILAAGWLATEGWTDAAMARLSEAGIGVVVPVGLSPDDRETIVSAGIRRTMGGRRVPVVSERKSPRRSSFVATSCRPPMGPVLEAGFWRADVLATVGPGFSTACGDANADADIVAAVAALGTDVVLEPSARVIAGGERRTSSAFTAGLHAERLFWRSLAGTAIVPALLLHAAEVVRHAAATAPLGTLPMLAGRLAGVMQFGSCLARARQLESIRRQSRAATPLRTLRRDEPHAPLATPHQDVQATPLKRSA
jgi:hypothetical protein